MERMKERPRPLLDAVYADIAKKHKKSFEYVRRIMRESRTKPRWWYLKILAEKPDELPPF